MHIEWTVTTDSGQDEEWLATVRGFDVRLIVREYGVIWSVFSGPDYVLAFGTELTLSMARDTATAKVWQILDTADKLLNETLEL